MRQAFPFRGVNSQGAFQYQSPREVIYGKVIFPYRGTKGTGGILQQ
jgi:hypothetical protein